MGTPASGIVKSSDFICAAAAGDDDEDSGDGGIDEVSDGDGDEQEEYEKWKVRLNRLWEATTWPETSHPCRRICHLSHSRFRRVNVLYWLGDCHAPLHWQSLIGWRCRCVSYQG
jgi:hypothetical protein